MGPTHQSCSPNLTPTPPVKSKRQSFRPPPSRSLLCSQQHARAPRIVRPQKRHPSLRDIPHDNFGSDTNIALLRPLASNSCAAARETTSTLLARRPLATDTNCAWLRVCPDLVSVPSRFTRFYVLGLVAPFLLLPSPTRFDPYNSLVSPSQIAYADFTKQPCRFHL